MGDSLPPETLALAAFVPQIRPSIDEIRMLATSLLRQAGEGQNAEERRYLDRIIEATQLLDRLIGDLEAPDPERSGPDLVTARIHPSQVLQSVIEAFQDLADRGQISLVLRLSPSLPASQADPDRLRQILTNLVSNALKFTPPGGTVTLSAFPRQDQIVYAVADTGEGIPSDALPRLFQSFYQVKPRPSGNGLGLAIAKQLVEAHGGQIHVASEPGKGTVFTFSVPAAPGRRHQPRVGTAMLDPTAIRPGA